MTLRVQTWSARANSLGGWLQQSLPYTHSWARSSRLFPAVGRVLVLALLLLLADVALLWLWPRVYHIDTGTYRAGFFLTNVSEPEGDEADPYRWTLGTSSMRIASLGEQAHALVTFELGGRPLPGSARVLVGDQEIARFAVREQPQRVTVALPQPLRPASKIIIESDTFSTPEDARTLGIRIDGIRLTRIPSAIPWPPVLPYLFQLSMLCMGLLIAIRLNVGRLLQTGVVAVLLVALVFGLGASLPMADLYFARLAAALFALTCATWFLYGRVETLGFFAGRPQDARLLWVIMLLACAIRAIATTFPTFAGQDAFYHGNWFREVLSGDLALGVHSSEFGGGVITYPPGTYVALAPLVLATNNLQALLQGPLALVDGAATLAVGLLAYQLGLGRTTALFASLLYASNLPTFTAFAYGFSAQVLAQSLMAPLAIGLIYAANSRQIRGWLLAGLLFLLPMLVHVGVAILAATWVGGVLLILWLRRDYRQWWGPAICALAALIALLFVYSYGLQWMLAHAGDMLRSAAAPDTDAAPEPFFKGATPLLLKGARLAFSDIGLVLLPIGLLLLAQKPLSHSQRAVASAWILSSVFYFAIDMLLALQVRYLYFAIPIASIGIALVLSHIAGRRRWGSALAWGLVLIIFGQNVALWFGAVFGDVYLSLTPLTH